MQAYIIIYVVICQVILLFIKLSSKTITLNGDEADRDLTIEHRDYYGLLECYEDDSPEPELCM